MTMPGAESVSPSQLAVWLRARGWTVESELAGKYTRYTRDINGALWEVEVPFSSGLRDYARRLSEALKILGEAEQRPRAGLLLEIRSAHLDLVRFRIESEATRRGRVSIDDAPVLHQQVRDLFLAAACAAIEPRAAFPGRKPTKAIDYLRGLRVAPSEVGSYVLTVESPVAPALQPPFLEDGTDPPFERKAVQTLASALSATQEAVRRGGAALHLDPFVEAVEQGSSANLYEALATMLQPFEGAVLETTVSFGSVRPAPSQVVSARFDAESVPVLREAARVLKEREPIPDLELEGLVVTLTSEDPSRGGVMVVLGPVDGRLRRVRVEVGAEEYELATRAHSERRVVSVEGDLQGGRGALELKASRRLRVAVWDNEES